MDSDHSSFREKLEQAHTYPTLYMFKFIVRQGQVDDVKALFPKNEVELKPSSGGKYVSATAKVLVTSSDQIIDIYTKAKEIEGIISL